MKYVYQFTKSFLIIAGMIFIANNASAQCGQRFHDKIFMDSLVSNIQYGENLKSTGANQILLLDIYFPAGDTETNRPLILIAHGGNFLAGSKTGTDVVPLAKDWARMGYVVASIEYRVGMTNFPLPGPDSTDAGAAVMRAVHDSRAAVRFFKNSFANGNPYGIDTSLIFFSGVSAGGFMALHVGYMDEIAEFPSYIDTVNQYGITGGIEGNSNNYPYRSNVTAIINVCGAIGDTAWINAGDIPVLSFHGNIDETVPFGSDVITLVGLYPLLQVDGSASVAERADEMGILNCFEIYENQNHTPHITPASTAPQYYDTTLNISRNFMAYFVCGDAMNCAYGPVITSVDEIHSDDKLFTVFPNPASTQAEIVFHEYKNGAVMNLYDVNGKNVLTQIITSDKITIQREGLPAGMYLIRITQGEKVQSGKVMFE